MEFLIALLTDGYLEIVWTGTASTGRRKTPSGNRSWLARASTTCGKMQFVN
jgi:hypothetical protein